MDKVNKNLADIERKLGKISDITAKGPGKITVRDMIKLSAKGNSITATGKKLKGYEVILLLSPQTSWWL